MELVQDGLKIDTFLAVTLGIVVLFVGKRINASVLWLREFGIPEPVTGGLLLSVIFTLVYMVTGVATEYFYLFQIPKFESTRLFDTLIADYLDMTFKEFKKPIDFFNKNIMGAWLVWILIAIHSAAALYHHLIPKDRMLRKMTSG